MSNIGQGFKPKATQARLPPNTIACKCQICNCGSHKCPPDRHLYELTPYEKENLKTNYQANYTPHPLSHVPRRDEHRPKQDLIFGDSKFDGQTTCQSDFRAPSGGALARPAKPPNSDPNLIHGGSNERDFTSENRANFAPKGYAKRESYAPAGASHLTHLPFEGASITSTDYHAHQGAKPSTPFKESPTVGGTKEDRDFQSESALKYVPHGNQKRQGFAPAPRSQAQSIPFEGQSTTASDYRGIAAPPAKAFIPQQKHTAENETRDFKSTYAADHQPKGYQVRESFKPVPDRSAANLPFQATSTHHSDFTGQQGPKAQSARPSVGLTNTIGVPIGSKDDRQFLSENHGQFDQKGFHARQSYAPMGASHLTHLPFEGASITSTDYHAHQGAKPSTPFKESPTVGGTKEDRDFQSESALKYVPHGNQKRQGFAPAPRSQAQSVPFEGESTTKSDYKPWKREGCPAQAIPDYPDQYRGKDGHLVLSNRTGKWEPYVNNAR